MRGLDGRRLRPKALYSSSFVRKRLEYRVKLRYREEIVHSLLHVGQLDLLAFSRTGILLDNQLAQAGAVDIAHVAEIQQEVFLAPFEQVLHRLAHYSRAIT